VKSSVLPSPGPMTGAYSLRRSRHRTMRPTARELQVLRLVAQGLSSKQIARDLGIGVSTVRTHRQALLNRTGCTSMAAVIAVALRRGWIE
jgi:DNA-binding NarL/FixJ family response regulator